MAKKIISTKLQADLREFVVQKIHSADLHNHFRDPVFTRINKVKEHNWQIYKQLWDSLGAMCCTKDIFCKSASKIQISYSYSEKGEGVGALCFTKALFCKYLPYTSFLWMAFQGSLCDELFPTILAVGNQTQAQSANLGTMEKCWDTGDIVDYNTGVLT